MCPAKSINLQRDSASIIGLASIVRMAYDGRDMNDIWSTLVDRVSIDPNDASALLDMSTILQATGERQKALELQATACRLRRIYRKSYGRGDGLRIVALLSEGDFMTNTPIEFLLEHSNAVIWNIYIGKEVFDLNDLPEHDIIVVAIGESAETRHSLVAIEQQLVEWRGPVFNRATSRIAALTREHVAELLGAESMLVVPETVYSDRIKLQSQMNDAKRDLTRLGSIKFPVIIRPLGSHAGFGLVKVNSQTDLLAYLAERREDKFNYSKFVDYRSKDGLYRKYRIAFVEGQPFACHMAISDHWMVHYLSAGMGSNAERRHEESTWMQSFDQIFALRHASAFATLTKKLGFDYFVIDCAETSDGSLLLFEADIAMIVHSLDDVGTFPYKGCVMRKLFFAYCAALHTRVETYLKLNGPA